MGNLSKVRFLKEKQKYLLLQLGNSKNLDCDRDHNFYNQICYWIESLQVTFMSQAKLTIGNSIFHTRIVKIHIV